MVEVLLHLYRASQDKGEFADFQLMTETRTNRAENEIHLRGNGSLSGFFLRVSFNSSLSQVHLNLLKNNVLQRQIVLDGPAQVGTFLPFNQLPVGFLADDIMVMQWSGISTTKFITAEVGFELRFTSQSAPAP